MNNRDDIYSKEATLVSEAKRELANGLEKDPIDKLRLRCFTKGCTGILDLAKALRRKANNSDTLSLEKFTEGIKHANINCGNDEIKTLYNSFTSAKSKGLNATEFLAKLRPSLGRSRLSIINTAFGKVDKNNEGVITVGDLGKMYSVRNNPKYLTGDLTEEELLKQFLSIFDGGNGGKDKGAKITKEEFINYYAGVSASIDNDAYFDLMVRRAYKL